MIYIYYWYIEIDVYKMKKWYLLFCIKNKYMIYIFIVDTLRSMSLEWENDIYCFVLEVNIWCTFVIDILELMSLEWEKESCSIEFMSETCNCENLVKDNQNENWI